MEQSQIISQYKKEITVNYKKHSNEELIEMLNNGKRTEVINSLLPMVIHIANKFYSKDDFEELISVGNLGLIKGIDDFNIKKSDNIISYSHSMIKWSILDYFRQKDFIKLPVHLKSSSEMIKSYPTIVDYDNLENIDYVEDNVGEKLINRKELENLLMTIPKIKYSNVQCFLDYFLIPNMTYEKLSINLGFTKQNASLINNKIIHIIKSNPKLLERFREILF